MLEGKCHCGEFSIGIPRRPRVLTRCNCSICCRIQPLFAYFIASSIKLYYSKGTLESYVWGKGALRWYRCGSCGCFTHHAPVRAGDAVNPSSRLGVNLHLVHPTQLHGIEVKVRDGAANTWDVIKSYRYND